MDDSKRELASLSMVFGGLLLLICVMNLMTESGDLTPNTCESELRDIKGVIYDR